MGLQERIINDILPIFQEENCVKLICHKQSYENLTRRSSKKENLDKSLQDSNFCLYITPPSLSQWAYKPKTESICWNC